MKFDIFSGRQGKTFKITLIITLAFGLIVGGGLKYLKHKGAPQYSGEVKLEGLKGSVTIKFDKSGIPHINAEFEEDAFQGLGYLMAQDRLFQMDIMRRVARGQLSEVFGPKAIETDKLFRTLNLLAPFKSKSFNQADDVKAVMDAFYRGVNQFISRKNWPFEYTLLGIEPKPFNLMDGYGILGYMAYSFAMGLKTDPFIEMLHQKVGFERSNELRREPLPPKVEKTVYTPYKLDSSDSIWRKGHNFVEQNIGLFSGSNAWVLSPKRSFKGQSILASDPHVSFSIPGLWYEAHVTWRKGLSRSPYEFYGHFVPNLPFPAMAHTKNHGWAVTISYLDDMDFIWQKTKEGKFFEDGNWISLKKRKEIIKVKGEEDVVLTLEESTLGPLVGDLLGIFDIKQLKSEEGANVALKWGHHEKDNRPGRAFYGALMAKDKREFENSLAFGRSPGVNVIYADKEGNIARYLFGTQYKRFSGDSGDRFNIITRKKDYSLYDVIPFEDRSHLINPESGVVVSANQKPENTPELKSGYFQPFDRYQTIHQILAGKNKWSLEELQIVQTAPVNVFFPRYLRAIEKAIRTAKMSDKERQVWKRFRVWDGRSTTSSAESLIFYTFFNNFQRELLGDLPDEQYNLYCRTNYIWHFATRKLLSEERVGEIRLAFKKTVKDLFRKHGPMANWQLGEEQTLTLAHPLSRGGAHLAFFLDVGPYPMDGGFNQINNMRPVGCEDGLKIKAGPSTRRLVSFDNPGESYGILPLGNSGHYGSPFFLNQWTTFREGGYRRQLMRELKKDEIHSELVFTKK